MSVERELDLWDKVFVRAPNVVARKIAGEMFLVPIAGKLADMQRLFALTAVAEFVWERLDSHRSLGNIRDDVLARFDASQVEVDADLEAFLSELMAEGLVGEVSP